MRSMVVLFAVVAAACGSLVPAQPPHYPALVLDPHGRPLDTAEVINARALHLQAKALEGHHYAPLAHSVVAPIAHSVLAAPAAVSHQSRVDVISGHGVLAAHAAPVWGGHAALSHSSLGLAGHGHYLKKRSLGHLAYSAHIIAPAAVSHQSRVDVISSPAVVSHAIAAPVHAYAAPVVAHAIAPAAVSHQSRVDVRTSPAVVSHSVVAAPLVAAHSAWAAPTYGVHGQTHSYGGLYGGLSHGHYLKKRSLAVAHVVPAAGSHQSRVDVISSPAVVAHATYAHAAPIAVAHAAPITVAHVVPAAVSHQARVDVISSAAHVAPIAHSAIWAAPAHYSHWGSQHSSPLSYATHW